MELQYLENRTVFLVEDEVMITMMIEDMLDSMGCRILGPAVRLSDAARLVSTAGHVIDAAILDVNVGGEESYPLARRLIGMNIPVIFSSGYGPRGVKAEFAQCPVLQKPFSQEDLFSRLAEALRTGGAPG